MMSLHSPILFCFKSSFFSRFSPFIELKRVFCRCDMLSHHIGDTKRSFSPSSYPLFAQQYVGTRFHWEGIFSLRFQKPLISVSNDADRCFKAPVVLIPVWRAGISGNGSQTVSPWDGLIQTSVSFHTEMTTIPLGIYTGLEASADRAHKMDLVALETWKVPKECEGQNLWATGLWQSGVSSGTRGDTGSWPSSTMSASRFLIGSTPVRRNFTPSHEILTSPFLGGPLNGLATGPAPFMCTPAGGKHAQTIHGASSM